MNYEVGKKYWLTDTTIELMRSIGFGIRWTGEAFCDGGERQKQYEITSVPDFGEALLSGLENVTDETITVSDAECVALLDFAKTTAASVRRSRLDIARDVAATKGNEP